MKTIMKSAAMIVVLVILAVTLTACKVSVQNTTSGSKEDKQKTISMADTLSSNQPTPDDISYSLERYNLIRRAYWVNGQREKANALVCEIEKPLGYIVLFAGNTIFGRFVVDGKVTSLNSYLTPDSEYYELCYGGNYERKNAWLADVDGSYGENDNGIFFFTPDGKYVEWTGEYMYSDIPFTVDNPVVSWEAEK